MTRICVTNGTDRIIANLNVLTEEGLLSPGQIGLSNSAAAALGARNGMKLQVLHMPVISSLSHVRAKIYGQALSRPQFEAIISDVVKGNYSNVHLAGFIAACAGDKFSLSEIIDLTKVMVSSGSSIEWDAPLVADKHCVGGLPGNRTTPIVVAIAVAAGLTMPKTSSRAITSPAGTADTMETMCPVELDVDLLKRVVIETGGCIAWGGTADLSPADDMLIRVEKALDIDSEGQMIASVLSKKVAAGSTHVVIDIPVGPTAKVRSDEEADRLEDLFQRVGAAIGLKIKVLQTDGRQPIGNGIGPALEARDVLAVLRNEALAPDSLKDRSIKLAGALLELTEITTDGIVKARQLLESGEALECFMAICERQGGFHEPVIGPYSQSVISKKRGTISRIDNRKLARVAKLAGAPNDPGAGILFSIKLGDDVARGQTLYTIHSESEGELNYALNFLNTEDGKDIICVT